MSDQRGIRQRGPDTFEVRYYVPDKGMQSETVRGTLQDAIKLRALRLSAIAHGKHIAHSRLRVDAVLADWLATREATQPAYSATLRNQRSHIRQWQQAIGRIQLQKLTVRDIDDALAVMLQTRGAKTVRDRLGWLRVALKWAVACDLVGRNVAAIATPPRTERTEMRFWNLPDLARFLAEAPKHGVYGRMLAVGALTGWRTHSEWGGMPRSGVDLDARPPKASVTQVLKYGGALVPAGGSKSHRRQVTLAEVVLPYLEDQDRWLKEQWEENGMGWNPHRLLWVNELGKPVGTKALHATFREILAAAKLPEIRIHDLRHTYATLMLGRGVNIKVIQNALGHSNPVLTLAVYSHLIPGLEEAAAETLSAAIREQRQAN